MRMNTITKFRIFPFQEETMSNEVSYRLIKPGEEEETFAVIERG